MKILICDDDQLFLKKIENMIQTYCREAGLSIQLVTASRKRELEKIDCSAFDIAFLDIDMGEFSGLDVARMIRSCNKDAIVIFVTNYLEYAPESFEVDAFRYLLKPKMDEKLRIYLQEAVDLHKEKHQIVSLQISGEVIDIPVEQILYIESMKRVITLYRTAGTGEPYRFYMTMDAMEKQLEPMGFLRIQKSYLVNMAYIQNLQCGQVVLNDQTTLKVSKKNYPEIKRKFLLWRGKHKWII